MHAREKRTAKRPRAVTPIENIRVSLKPILGIHPRIYVLFIWLILITLTVFLLLILPGIRSNGTVLTVESIPPDASVIVDGHRLGSTGKAIFVPHGKRELSVERFGFIPHRQSIDFGGRIFASKLFPLRLELSVVLDALKDYNHLARGVREFAAWAETGPERERYAIPPVLTSAARDALRGSAESKSAFIAAALPICIDERHLADIARAIFILESGGTPPGLGSIAQIVSSSAHSSIPIETILELIDERRLPLLGSEERGKSTQGIAEGAEAFYAGAGPFASIAVYGGIAFAAVGGITAPLGDIELASQERGVRSGAIPIEAAIDAFRISTTEVSNAQFALFLSENPEWLVRNIENLESQNLVDEDYLSSWSSNLAPAGFESYPVTEISWHAAQAYCEWFTRRYLVGSQARLPTEDEWELAARQNQTVQNTSELPAGIRPINSADSGAIGIIGMAGNVREWCFNPYRINESRFRPANGQNNFLSPSSPYAPLSRPVRGGAHIDDELEYPAAVRGRLPAHRTSPVVGFRIVIAP